MKKPNTTRLGILAGALVLGACTVMPTGPTVMVLPGTGQSIENFREDDGYCRRFAFGQIGGRSAEQAARESAVTSAAIGTAIGAVAGAALGGRDGAAVGAGAGLLVGSATGADTARSSGYGTQRQYDNAYVQCMYSKGHRVPVAANMASQPRAVRAPAPVSAPDANIPPPPPGAPPPPPPGR
ncbi:MAG: YMGG-like glycine zipper-containing protein [Bacteroidota bacterium]